jgi:hypothetical protein
MAVLEGGIFSRPRGKTGGIVFGAARTRQGKQVTSRLLVPPSNPNTTAQQEQRGIFSSAQSIVRKLGSTVYQVDWNRSVGQLPGFQSMQSIFMNQMDTDLDLTLVNNINLGTLPNEPDVSADPADPGVIAVTWTNSYGEGAEASNVPTAVAVCTTAANRALVGGVQYVSTNMRADEAIAIEDCIAGATYQIYFYFKGTGTQAGMLSPTAILTSIPGA